MVILHNGTVAAVESTSVISVMYDCCEHFVFCREWSV